ncbi:NAD(P)H-dependent oxidoreductase [Acuticoccus sp. I52.16.1]|uniref:NAD(P)H-dependent oxidoreductase n=1 Tax=Acuticoccus sp. I52.16.1 TaxID=2928472 RepID=UPI001FD1977E|nr:NAD(P)H-dependent oxidoreductase [Acuticoccus sp. I52.16.1]UOM35841.1 NAD(P)H-dependent oxidoreductase [Acuticoccus sp. I52.16.1]
MRVLVVVCHPDPESFTQHLAATSLAALARAGHDVRHTDLYAEGFDPVMSRQERLGYHTPGDNEIPIAGHLADLRWCEAVLFHYPTWWFGLPAMLKGWLDRVLVPYATFALPTATEPMRGTLENIRRLSIVTTAGAPTLYSKLVGEPGRRTILRGMRALCHRRCRTDYVALHRIDSADAATCARFVTRVEALIARY